MRVAHFLSSTTFHGAEAMAAELIQQLASLGVQNHVLLLDNAGRVDRQILSETDGDTAGSAVLPCDGALDIRTFRALGRYLAVHDIDLVHSHKYKTSFYALPVCHWQGRAVLSTYHNWIGGSASLRVYNRLDQSLARFNHLAVSVSTPVMQVLRRHVPTERCRQIDNGINTERFRPPADRAAVRQALGLAPNSLVLGCVGRLSAEKGISRLLEAVATAFTGSHAPEDWVLLLVGDGDQRESLQVQAEVLGLASRVRFLGHRRDTPALYGSMDLYLLPSLLEAFPMALLEAMACGCSVMAADVGEVRRMLDDGRVGHVIAAAEGLEPWIQALRSFWIRWNEERPVMVDLGQVARERVQAHYSSQAMASNYLQAYKDASWLARRQR